LSDALSLPTTNPLELIEARKDKAEMQEALRANGVPAAEQFKSGNLDELLVWARNRNQWPLVAKPVGGAGSDGIFFCQNEEDVKSAHAGIIGQWNPTGVVNNELALQEFLSGDEYIVDTVSYGGKHICVAIWVYTKVKGLPWNPHAIMAKQNMLLAPSGEKQDQLVDYVFKVLDAVGLNYGPCHTEVMFTARGPILVEVNARLHGLQGPKLIELCTGISKATYAADTIISDGRLFQELSKAASPGRYLYPVIKQAVNLCLISPVEGFLQNSISKVIVDMGLPSVMEILPNVQQGGYLCQTIDLASLAGTVIMVHESMDQIKQDIQKIRDVEESLVLYNVSTVPSNA
jgi:biotin carboxylase